MNKQTISNTLVKELEIDNKTAHRVAGLIWSDACTYAKEKVAEATASGGEGALSDQVQYFLDNPMDPEDESRFLRAILHAGLSTGNVSPQVLEKIDKIIGINSGRDESIEVVDFLTAFPDLAEAIELCHKPMPEIVE